MESSGLKVSVVIVTFNGMKWMKECLDTLLESSMELSVFIIDNQSTDGTVNFIRQNYDHRVTLIVLDKNEGFGKANNIGIVKALEFGAQYIGLINQDVYVAKNAFEQLVKVHQAEPQYGIISPMHLNGKGTAFDQNFSSYISKIINPDLQFETFPETAKKNIYAVDFVNAAAWLISRECIEAVGGFSPTFFHYGEDSNYVQRVHFHGLKVGVTPKSIIRHDRETRTENKYFDDSAKRYKLALLYRSSDPNVAFSFSKEYQRLYKRMIKELLVFHFKKSGMFFRRIKVLAKADKETIVSNREQSKTKGKSFL